MHDLEIDNAKNKNHSSDAGQAFEEKYLRLRQKENRYYTDVELLMLPDIDKQHVHYKEWQIRKQSCLKLLQYLKKNHSPGNILEVGCGNGWLSHQLAGLPLAVVTGVDINQTELAQAERVFSYKKNLHFQYGDIRNGIFEENSFDTIVFAASIQYFPVLDEIIYPAISLLKPQGEIHVIDTVFYNSSESANAKKRSSDYFSSLNCPEMTDHYFHHSFHDLASFSFDLLDQRSYFSGLLFGKRIFPWIRIKKGDDQE